MSIVTEHLTFDLQTQLKLDNLFDEWSRFDKVCAENGYQDDAQNFRLDAMALEYEAAKEAAYKAIAQAEAERMLPKWRSQIFHQLLHLHLEAVQ